MTNPESLPGSDAFVPPIGKPGTHTPSFLKQLYQCVSIAALAMVSYFLVSQFLLQSVKVVGVSMAPTLLDSQSYVLNRWIYYFREPQRTDVVVIRDPYDQGFSVKRIIGIEGDTVYLNGGKVYLNGRVLTEPYLAKGMPTIQYNANGEALFRCGKGEYFLLGDNRRNSADSRSYGAVGRRNVLGMISP